MYEKPDRTHGMLKMLDGKRGQRSSASELNDLLCCPFCGSKDIDESFCQGYEKGDMTQPVVGAGCNDCGATGPMVRVPDHSTGYKEAAEKWNTRT